MEKKSEKDKNEVKERLAGITHANITQEDFEFIENKVRAGVTLEEAHMIFAILLPAAKQIHLDNEWYKGQVKVKR